jgi:FkbM family methyltransferase
MKTNSAEDSLRLYRQLYQSGYGNINTIVDVGIESFTRSLINVFPDAHHYLFEPGTVFNKDIAESYKNISHTLINVALSDHVGPAVISGHNRHYSHEVGDIETEFTTLDTYFNDKPDVWTFDTLVKIDTDGLELEIIRGGTDFLKSVGMLMVESTTAGILGTCQAMTDLNFELWDITSPCYYYSQLFQADLLFINQRLKNTVGNSTFRTQDHPFDMSQWINGEIL